MTRFGWGALALLALLVFGSLAAVISRATLPISLGPGDWSAICFTLYQSLISASLSVLVAIPVARALARRRFPGRAILIIALGAPFILPVIVAVFGLLAIWGRSGLISDALGLIGMGRLDIYGLPGVVLAHVFFNLPLATRLILQGWSSIPAEHFRLSAQLGMSARHEFQRLEVPMLRQTLPGAFVLVFILCMTSFATVLALGGGPKATSVELAIYSALRFDFDLGRAAVLALVQVALSAAAAVALLSVGRPIDLGKGLGAPRQMWQDHGRIIDAIVIGAVTLFLLLPLRTLLAISGAMGIATVAARAKRGWLIEVTATLVLVVSPFVLGTGLFIIINPYFDPPGRGELRTSRKQPRHNRLGQGTLDLLARSPCPPWFCKRPRRCTLDGRPRCHRPFRTGRRCNPSALDVPPDGVLSNGGRRWRGTDPRGDQFRAVRDFGGLAGFDTKHEGELTIDGTDMGNISPQNRPVTLMFQDHNLFPHLSVTQNVGLGIDPGLRLDQAARRASASRRTVLRPRPGIAPGNACIGAEDPRSARGHFDLRYSHAGGRQIRRPRLLRE